MSGGRVVLLALTSTRGSQVRIETNPDWELQECRIVDEEGNSFERKQTRWLDFPERRETVVGIEYSLESNRVWKVEAKFTAARAHPFVREDSLPASDTIKTEVSAEGPEARIVDAFGSVYFCGFNGKRLSVRREAGLDRPYFVLLQAKEEGQTVSFGANSWWQGGRFDQKIQQWDADKAATNLVVRFLVPKIIETEFYAMPSVAVEGDGR